MGKLKLTLEVNIGKYPKEIALQMIVDALNNSGLHQGIVTHVEEEA